MPRHYKHVPGFYEITFIHISDPEENLIIDIPVSYLHKAGVFLREVTLFQSMTVKFVTVDHEQWEILRKKLGWDYDKIKQQFETLTEIYQIIQKEK
jgi:hypothetical protein